MRGHVKGMCSLNKSLAEILFVNSKHHLKLFGTRNREGGLKRIRQLTLLWRGIIEDRRTHGRNSKTLIAIPTIQVAKVVSKNPGLG